MDGGLEGLLQLKPTNKTVVFILTLKSVSADFTSVRFVHDMIAETSRLPEERVVIQRAGVDTVHCHGNLGRLS